MHHPPEIENNAMIKNWQENTSELELTCVVLSSPRPRVDWYRDGHLLDQRHHVISSFGRNFTLLLSNITTDKIPGRFECRAQNDLGEASAFSDGTAWVSQISTTPQFLVFPYFAGIDENWENVSNDEEYPSLQTSVYEIVDDITNRTLGENFEETEEESENEVERNSTFFLQVGGDQSQSNSIEIEESQGNIAETSLVKENDDLTDEEESVIPSNDIYYDISENMNSSLSFDVPEDFTNGSSLTEDIERFELAGNARVLSSLDSEHDTRYSLEWLVISPSEVLESTVKFRVEDGGENDWYFITAKLRKDEPDVFVGKVVLEHLIPGTEYRVHIASKNLHDYNSFSDSFFFTTKHTENTDTENLPEEELIEEVNATMEDIEGSGSGDGDDLLTRQESNYENDTQEFTKDEHTVSMNVPRDHNDSFQKESSQFLFYLFVSLICLILV